MRANAAELPIDSMAIDLRDIVGRPPFPNALPGLIAEPERAPIVLQRLEALAQ